MDGTSFIVSNHQGTDCTVTLSTDATLILTDGPPDDYQCEVQHEANLLANPPLQWDYSKISVDEIVLPWLPGAGTTGPRPCLWMPDW